MMVVVVVVGVGMIVVLFWWEVGDLPTGTFNGREKAGYLVRLYDDGERRHQGTKAPFAKRTGAITPGGREGLRSP